MALIQTQWVTTVNSIQLVQTKLPRFAFTPDEAAQSTGFSKTRIFQAIGKGKLTARKDGRVLSLKFLDFAFESGHPAGRRRDHALGGVISWRTQHRHSH